jgi:hypothetical protein
MDNSLWVHQYNWQLMFCEVFHKKKLCTCYWGMLHDLHFPIILICLLMLCDY